MLGNSASIPVVSDVLYDDRLSEILKEYGDDNHAKINALHLYAKELLDIHQTEKAWQVLLSSDL